MMTLEQLYTDSNYQIAEQLDLKIQTYLGPMNSYKKQIKSMYNIRSRFLHGDMPILPIHKETDEIPQHESDLYEAYEISASLIITTLQKMYIDNLLYLKFQYKLTP